MNGIKKVSLCSIICLFYLTACTTLPDRALYTESVAKNVSMNTLNSQFDVSYAIDCCLMPKKKNDFLSLNIDTMLYTCRLNFSIEHGMKTIFDRFFAISQMADVQNKQNGIRYLGETTLFAYAFFEDTVTRLVVTSKIPNHVRFSFLMKDGQKYLLLEGFHINTLDGSLAIDDTIDSIPLRYEDIRKAYNFFADEEALAARREKQLHIEAAAKKTKNENTHTTDTVIQRSEASAVPMDAVDTEAGHTNEEPKPVVPIEEHQKETPQH